MKDTATEPLRTCVLCLRFFLGIEITPGAPADWGCRHSATPSRVTPADSPSSSQNFRGTAQRCEKFQLSYDALEEMLVPLELVRAKVCRDVHQPYHDAYTTGATT